MDGQRAIWPLSRKSGSGGSAGLPTGSGSESGSGASSTASAVEPGLVDINVTLSYQNEEAAGTGMVLTSSGEVLTNNRVIRGASSIRVVEPASGRTYTATVVGYDLCSDVAVIQLEHASDLQTVALGNSDAAKIGCCGQKRCMVTRS